VVLGACSDEEPELTDDWADADGCSDGKCDDASAVAPVSAPGLLVNDPATLHGLESGGYALSRALGGDSANNAALAESSPLFARLAQTIERDLVELRAADAAAGVGLAYSHRQFDARWLRSAKASFSLVAVVNRLDLMHRTPGACGEVRFIYRLQYATAQGTSRLPMTINVVHDQPAIDGSCSGVAAAWQSFSTSMLAPYRTPQRVEINLQAVRWPAVTRADMGGYAEYLLRVFDVQGASLVPMLLPNTIRPDLSAAQKAGLAAWIAANVDGIDRGDALVPAEYLAMRAISVSPRGLARGANRPFLAAFPRPEQTFGGLRYDGMQLVKSPAGLLRKLDTMTCQGCHQARGLAGFHILGEEDATTARANAIEVGSSPHFNEELPWRRAALDDVASGRAIARPRPFAERSGGSTGIYGAHCGLAGDPSFAGWTCATGYECKDISGEEIGMCVAKEVGAGDSCETSDVSFDPDPRKDKGRAIETHTCGIMPTGRRGYCNHSGTKPFTSSSFGGFPNGSCSNKCLTMGKHTGDAICGAQPPDGFNECLGSGKPFTQCLQNATPEFRRRCDSRTPCGDDYVCAGVSGAPKGVGACMPPYFIFQVRVDGHIVR